MPNSAPPFQPTTSVLNDKDEAVAWDLLEQSSKEIGLPATAKKYGVKLKALHARKTSHKWKGCPDARSLAKGKQGSNSEIVTTNGDLSAHIPGFRARTFQKIDESIKKFRPKAPKSFRELDSAVKVGERMLGIGEDTGRQSLLISINEAIEDHEAERPIEAHEIVPCNPAPLAIDEGQQGSTTPPAESNVQKESDAPKESAHSLTLNPSDHSRRRFVVP